MDKARRECIGQVLDSATELALATIRPDGYPQATNVSSACRDMLLYTCLTATGATSAACR